MNIKNQLTVLLLSLIVTYYSALAQSNTTNETGIPPIINNKTTENDLQNSSVATNTNSTTVTTPTPLVTTTTQTSTTQATKAPISPEAKHTIRTLSNFYCLCDDHFNFCDLNCCCDPDCSSEEKAVFSDCSDIPSTSTSRNQRSCFKSDYFFRNNTPYIIEQSKSGLLCIAYDNYIEEELVVPKFLPGKIPALLEPKYEWNHIRKSLGDLKKHAPYKYKSIVRTLKVTEFGEFNSSFDLPSSFHGHECLALEPISFMKDTTELCVYQVEDLKSECETFENYNANTFLRNIFVLGNPMNEFPDENLLSITSVLCDVDNTCIQAMTIDDPFVDNDTSTCKNILLQLDITFVHNGVEGIRDVFAKIMLGNPSTNEKKIRQEFKVNFVWKKIYVGEENEITKDNIIIPKQIPRSGNPGYSFGKPVVMGIKIFREMDPTSNKSQKVDNINAKETGMVNEKEEVVLLNSNSKKWMTVLSPGKCRSNDRKSVLFGLSINAICSVNVSHYKSCQELQLAIGNILLGVPPVNFTQRYVSTFGNPTFDDIRNWVPVLISESPFGSAQNSFNLVDNGCDGVTASVHIEIAYAYVGSIQYPQAKIVGVLYEFGLSSSFPNISTRGENSNIFISTTVGFSDITSTPTAKIAEWPILSIQLPPDFFYPFSWSSNSVPSPYRKTLLETLKSVILPMIVLCQVL